MLQDLKRHTPHLSTRKSNLQCRRTVYGFQHLNKSIMIDNRFRKQKLFSFTFWIGSKSLYGQRTAAVLQHIDVVILVM